MKTIIQSILIYFGFLDFGRIATLWLKYAAIIVLLSTGFNFIYFFVFFDFTVMTSENNRIHPNSAEWTIWPPDPFRKFDPDAGPRPPRTTGIYFLDGAICAKYVDVWTNHPVLSDSNIQALDPADSRRHVSVKIEQKPDPFSQKRVCTEVVPDSTEGVLARWRGVVAHFSNVPLLGWVALLVLSVAVLFAAVYVAGISLIVFTSLGPGIRNSWRLWRIPQSTRWSPEVADTSPIIVQISDPHITLNSEPYEIQVAPTMWPFSRPVDTLRRFRSILAHVSALPEPPPI